MEKTFVIPSGSDLKIDTMLGKHIIAEVYFENAEILNDDKKLVEAMELASVRGGMTVITSSSHKFAPHGATAIVMLSESHVSIHTWPEYGYAALDIYTCGKNPERVYEELLKILPIRKSKVKIIERGLY
jgi:S-adenosylmethionine decarboxylase